MRGETGSLGAADSQPGARTGSASGLMNNIQDALHSTGRWKPFAGQFPPLASYRSLRSH